jgi:16S rRNA (guanine966-N2)-methyltransferase
MIGVRMRIIAGSVGGRLVRAPKGAATRPTSDRVREAIFNILKTQGGPDGRVPGARVLDLYAGSGALGIEALSRGAVELVAVDESLDACHTIHQNLGALGLEGRARVVREKALRFLRTASKKEATAFHLIFADPPYEAQNTGEIDKALRLLDQQGLIAEDGIVVTEHDWRLSPVTSAGLELVDQRRYGQTTISFYERGTRPEDSDHPDRIVSNRALRTQPFLAKRTESETE